MRPSCVLLASALASLGCAVSPPPVTPAPPSALAAPDSGYRSTRYADPSAWLCLPGRNDACAADLDATDLLPDGARIEVRDAPRAPPDDVDCFYVYPTVDLRPWPASHTDFDDLGPMSRVAAIQAARFRSVCHVYAPLYRQTTIGTYLQGDAVRKPYRDVAVSDVVDAFVHYMAQYNHGHRIVLLGHSQGSEMLVELLKRFFDGDAAMREKLVVAMPIGWPLDVAPGQAAGGTFANIPACTQRGQTGCVIAYRSYADGEEAKVGRAVPAPGRESMCVNPAELAHGTGVYSRAFISKPPPPWKLVGLDGMRTPFVLVRDFYQARCVARGDGLRYLAVSVARRPGDVRASPIDLGLPVLHGVLGYHILDVQLALGDLVDIVAERVRAPAPQRPAGSAQTATP